MSERLPSQRTMKTREHRNMNAIRATSPSRRQLPQKTTENPQILTPELFIKRLFGQVRADCSVFYSTPHPPHFWKVNCFENDKFVQIGFYKTNLFLIYNKIFYYD